ncbi:unnamed protein product, partial [marine sediment metagenome]
SAIKDLSNGSQRLKEIYKRTDLINVDEKWKHFVSKTIFFLCFQKKEDI